MESIENILHLVEKSKGFGELCKAYENKSVTVHLENLVGGAL